MNKIDTKIAINEPVFEKQWKTFWKHKGTIHQLKEIENNNS